MHSGPALHYHLPARRAGAFGSSPIGRIAEAATLTWFRFELSLLWLLTVFLCLAILWPSLDRAAMALVASPAIAFAFWTLIKLSGWVFYFVPGMGKLWGWGRLAFLYLFSRLVVEQAPVVEMPAWQNR